MTNREHIELRLKLELGAGTMRGTLAGERGPETAFAGWLGLANALERALAAAESAAPTNPQESS